MILENTHYPQNLEAMTLPYRICNVRRISMTTPALPVTHHRTTKVDGVNIFYRESGPANAPVVLLLQGFPTSSHMFRNLIPALADLYHVIAPDYLGYGQSDMPDYTKFAYTFDHFVDLVDGLLDQLRITLARS